MISPRKLKEDVLCTWWVITAHKRSFGQGLSVHRGVPGQRLPRPETPPGQRPLHLLDRDPPDRDSPGQRPPLDRDLPTSWTETPRTETPRPLKSGWYASYWNAFLFYFVINGKFERKLQFCSTFAPEPQNAKSQTYKMDFSVKYHFYGLVFLTY